VTLIKGRKNILGPPQQIMRQFKYKDTDFFRISVHSDFRGGNKIKIHLGTPEHVMRQFAPEGQGLQDI
jgi:hypothetical protein